MASEWRPKKRIRLLSEEDSNDSSSDTSAGAAIGETESAAENSEFRINKEYARRFEHNHKRAELHRRKNNTF